MEPRIDLIKEMKSIDILIQECNWTDSGHEVERWLLIAMREHVIVGSSAISRDKSTPDDFLLESTFVSRSFRREGIAGLFYEKQLEIVERHGAKRIWCTVYRGNGFYIRWFIKRGFKVYDKDPVKDTIRIVKKLSTVE
ncbi:MAG: GNAT family N-acetyltransferase [Bacteroidetes bacterium]|nr:GNAT family N-acetyltransferase [Bacteroidota bacterium]